MALSLHSAPGEVSGDQPKAQRGRARASSRSADCGQCPLGRASLPETCPFRASTRASGEVLVRQGDVPAAVVFVKEGSVLVTSVGLSGEETGCAERGAGAILGLELVTGSRASYEARALSRVTVCTLSPSGFTRWVGDLDCRPGAILKLALSEATRQRQERVSVMGKAAARLARYLLARDRLEIGERPAKLQRRVLARMLGMRAETLSRAIATLRSHGVLARGSVLVVVDPVRLATLAEEGR